jgi:hypothetical protein
MNKKIYELLEDIGWRYESYEDFITFLPIYRKLLQEHWEFVEEKLLLNDIEYNEDLVNALGFVVDLIMVLEKENR